MVEVPLEDRFWDQKAGYYDVVTFWDVIEHVNFPVETLQAANRVLRDGGVVIMDTPRRDAAYHRIGESSSFLSGGKWPTLLKSMYNSTPFGHKQIFSEEDCRRLVDLAGFDALLLEPIKEFSFPAIHYARGFSRTLALGLEPIVKMAAAVSPVRNKLVVVGRKSA